MGQQSCILREKSSLDAVNVIAREFPYAATLLIYALLERCLKLYLLENRKTLTDEEVDCQKRVGLQAKRKLADYHDCDEDSFIKDFLMNCTLRSVERIFRVPEHKYSKDRNDLVHSNLYMTQQREMAPEQRTKENLDYLRIAKKNLVEASICYFKQPIIESDSLLKFM
jgi:hypothetical protein